VLDMKVDSLFPEYKAVNKIKKENAK
jgi:hypothetical protein